MLFILENFSQWNFQPVSDCRTGRNQIGCPRSYSVSRHDRERVYHRTSCDVRGGFSDALNWVIPRGRNASLSDSYTSSDWCWFFRTLRKLVFHFLSNCMEYDRGDSFSIDFEPNGLPFCSENWKENCHHNHIPFNSKGNGILLFSVYICKALRMEWNGSTIFQD